MQKATRMVMPMQEWLKVVNKPNTSPGEINGAWKEINKQINLSNQKFIFEKINTFENFKATLEVFNICVKKRNDNWGINTMNMFNDNYRSFLASK